MTVSTVTDKIEDLPLLYSQCIDASFSKLCRGNQCIIYAEDIEKIDQRSFQYPVHKEKQLISELMLGNTDACKEIYLEIISGISGYSRATVNFALSYLIYNLNTAINSIISINFEGNPLSIYSFSITLDEIETIEEVNDHFFKVFEDISNQLREKRISRNSEMIKQVKEYINEKHSDSNLTVQSISEAFHISSTHLGRLFKKISTENIVDYINHTRVEHARDLLKKSTLTVEQISSQCGFSTIAYFYRVFKKLNGLTPNEYRKNLFIVKTSDDEIPSNGIEMTGI